MSPISPTGKGRTDRHRADPREVCKTYPICLVTGGAGYIGSHTVLELLNARVAVVVLDNLVNSHEESLNRVWSICMHEHNVLKTGQMPPPLFFHNVDLRDASKLRDIFAYWQEPGSSLPSSQLPIDVSGIASKRHYHMLPYQVTVEKRPKPLASTEDETRWGKINSVIHFAALKAVGESVVKPLEYYDNNINGLLVLLRVMDEYNVKELVFSSSAVVYGRGNEENIVEDVVSVNGRAGSLANPYGRSKWFAEEILNDLSIANPATRTVALRYFNPTGANQSGLLGENPKGVPNNIVPVILQAYQRRRSKVVVFGSNYDTPDGTGVRDYIHVADLAKGHLAALRKLNADSKTMAQLDGNSVGTATGATAVAAQDLPPNYNVYNLGTGQGYSVLEILSAFSVAAGVEIPFQMAGARTGDLGTVTASTSKATVELEWEAEFGLQGMFRLKHLSRQVHLEEHSLLTFRPDMCRDVFNFATGNPSGYEVLRRLSSIAVPNQQTLRKASIASGIFKNDDDYNQFMTSAASIGRRDSGFGVPLNNAMRKLNMESGAAVTAAMRKMSLGPDPAAPFGNFRFQPMSDNLEEQDEFESVSLPPSKRPSNVLTAGLSALREEDERSPTAGDTSPSATWIARVLA